jgi:hypothetical protein
LLRKIEGIAYSLIETGKMFFPNEKREYATAFRIEENIREK